MVFWLRPSRAEHLGGPCEFVSACLRSLARQSQAQYWKILELVLAAAYVAIVPTMSNPVGAAQERLIPLLVLIARTAVSMERSLSLERESKGAAPDIGKASKPTVELLCPDENRPFVTAALGSIVTPYKSTSVEPLVNP